MKGVTKIVLSAFMALAFLTMLQGPALSADPVTITGTVNEDQQIVAEGGEVYNVGESEKSEEVGGMAGKKVKATGLVEESEGKRTIEIEEYMLVE